MNITIQQTETPQRKPDEKNLGFAKTFSDHMFRMHYTEGEGWHDFSIVPYGNVSLDPASMVLHYAQEVFEGLKAYRRKDGRIFLFRPEMNARRMNASNRRMCIPEISEAVFIEAVKSLVAHDADWVPSEPDTSLYIRPFIFGTTKGLAVHPAKDYTFMIITTPVGAYYESGVDPVKIYVEDRYVRAVEGGTGYTKCGGNYAASLMAQKKAEEAGFAQVLWLDGIEKKYIEEVGTMNVMFKVDGEIITAPAGESVLPGVTLNSCLTLLRDWGYKVTERKMPIEELMDHARAGRLEEAFGTGTAAVISPVGLLRFKEEEITINKFKTGDLTLKLYNSLTGIQWGKENDPYGWMSEVI